MTEPAGLPIVAVVLAGGTGSRMGRAVPKQLLEVHGRTILEHTVAALHACEEIDEIAVLMTPAFLDRARALLPREVWPKLTQVVAGGQDRNDSTRRALAALGDRECHVLFHDAVRPLVTQRIVTDVVVALRTYDAVTVAIASTDTLVRVDADDRLLEIPHRTSLRRVQTPQGFRLSTLRRAYELAARDSDFSATDDCSVVLRYLPEVPIHVVRGDERNLKVTHPIDLVIVAQLLRASQP